jgi:hypothetical protein
MVELLLEGRFTGKPEGVTKDAVSIKNISNRKIMSVMDDMLKAACTLCFEFRFMTDNYCGSCNKSIKLMEVYSILYISFCTLVTR